MLKSSRWLDFYRDCRGSMTVLFVILVPALLLIGGIATDVTMLNAQKRHLQRQVDLAAIAGASKLPVEGLYQRLAQQTFRMNGNCDRAHTTADCAGDVILRTLPYREGANGWEPSPSLAEATALYVEGQTQFRPLLLGAFFRDENLSIRRSGIARRVEQLEPMAAFTLRNRLLRVNTGQGLLGKLLQPLGIATTVDVLGSSGLASARVKLSDLLGLASATVGAEVLGFDALLNVPIKIQELLGLILYQQTDPTKPKHLLSGISWGGPGAGGASGSGIDGTVTLRELIDMPGDLAHLQVGDVLPDLEVGVLDMVALLAQLKRQDNQRLGVETKLRLISDRLLGADLSLGLIRSHVTGIKPVGPATPPQLTLRQTELQADLKILSLLQLQLSLNVAGAYASLTGLNCDAPAGSNETFATFAVRTAPLELGMDLNLFYTLSAEREGRPDMTMPMARPLLAKEDTADLSFTRREFETGVRTKTFVSSIQLESVGTQLKKVVDDLRQLANDRRDECLRRPLSCALDLLTNAISTTLATVTGVLLSGLQIDTVVSRLLSTLGIELASAEITLDDVYCNNRILAGARLVY